MIGERYRVAALPGDGIGPEVTREAVRVLRAVARCSGFEFGITEAPVGGAGLEAAGDPLPPESERACLDADAVLLGAVGHPRWDDEPSERRPEAGLLRLRRSMEVFANVRPVRVPPDAQVASPLRREVLDGGVDLVIVRELIGGLYYGERGQRQEGGGLRAFDTMSYAEAEIDRLLRLGFTLARQRRRRLTSVDKSNVLETSRLWRRVTGRVAGDYPDVRVDHLYVDNGAMQLVQAPARFDVIATENTFGDILSDLSGALVGSLGLLPSASLGAEGRPALYEPVHGSAPDIAGRGVGNPLGAIRAGAMMLHHSLGREREARAIEESVDEVLRRGPWTSDLAPRGAEAAATEEVGQAVAAAAERRLRPGYPPAAETGVAYWTGGDYGFRPVAPEEADGVAGEGPAWGERAR